MTQPFYEILLRSKGLEVSFDTTDPAFAAAQLKEWTQHLFGLSLDFPVPTPHVHEVVQSQPDATAEAIATGDRQLERDEEEALHPCLPEEFAHLVQNSPSPVQNPVESIVQKQQEAFTTPPNAPIDAEALPLVENFEEPVATPEVAQISHDAPSPAAVEAEFEDFMAALISDVGEEEEAASSSPDTAMTEAQVELPPVEAQILPPQPEEPVAVLDYQEPVVVDVAEPESVDSAPVSIELETEGLLDERPLEEPLEIPQQAVLALGVSQEMDVDDSALVTATQSAATATALLEPEPKTQQDVPTFSHIEVDSLRALFGYAPRAAMGEDYLLLSAYFLDHYRSQPAASMRDINAELVRSGLTPINHALIEGAVSKGLMELLPDTTGNAFATEYRLTPDGLRALEALLN